jgi:hypothetical protein
LRKTLPGVDCQVELCFGCATSQRQSSPDLSGRRTVSQFEIVVQIAHEIRDRSHSLKGLGLVVRSHSPTDPQCHHSIVAGQPVHVGVVQDRSQERTGFHLVQIHRDDLLLRIEHMFDT